MNPGRIHHKVNFSCDYAPVYSDPGLTSIWGTLGKHHEKQVNLLDLSSRSFLNLTVIFDWNCEVVDAKD